MSAEPPATTTPKPSAETCPQCFKPGAVCVCDRIVPLTPRTEVLILQHPQEPDKIIGSARLTELALAKTHVRVGLSWASLSHALGREVDAKKWGVLYLGSLKKPLTPAQLAKPVVVLDRQGHEIDPLREPLEGIVVLDGTWSQAKTLWWRNAWMLKLNRVLIHPAEPSIYGKLRPEPRRECLSTIEAVAEALTGFGERPEIRSELRRLFRTMVQRARDAQKAEEAARPPAPARPRGAKGGGRRRAPSRGGGPLD